MTDAAYPDSEQRASNLVTLGGTDCPVCSSRAHLSIDVGAFQLYACSSCKSFSSNALVRGAELTFAPTNYFENAHADRRRWDDLIARLTRAGLAVDSILDVGCGTGAFLEHFTRDRPAERVAGIELDPQRAQQARDACPGAVIHTGDALSLTEDMREEFDLITLWDVFEHVASPGALLKALSKRLSPKGWILIQTINERSVLPWLGRLSYRLSAGRLRAIALRTHEPHHLVFFSPKGIRRLAAASGLNVSECWFDRLDAERMDAAPSVVAIASVLMRLENLLGNGLFLNVIMDRSASRSAS